MAGNNNESTVIDFNESDINNSLEKHSTPNVDQDEKDRKTNITDETMVTVDSGVQLTPTSTKCNSQFDNDVMSFLQKQFQVINSRFDVSDINMNEQKSHFNAKFDEMNIQNVKFEISMNKLLNEMEECFNTIKEQVVESVEKQVKSKLNQIVNISNITKVVKE